MTAPALEYRRPGDPESLLGIRESRRRSCGIHPHRQQAAASLGNKVSSRGKSAAGSNWASLPSSSELSSVYLSQLVLWVAKREFPRRQDLLGRST